MAYALQFGRLHHRSLVEQNDIAELNLLNHKVFDIFFIDILAHQVAAALKFIFQTQSIYHGADAVEARHAVLHIFRAERRDRIDGLCYRHRLAYTTRLYHYIVEAIHRSNVAQLLHKVHLERAAYTAVLQSHQAIVLGAHHATTLYQVGIDVHLSYIVYYHRKAYAATIVQYSVHQCCLTAAKVSRKQQYWYFFPFHNYKFFITMKNTRKFTKIRHNEQKNPLRRFSMPILGDFNIF